MDRTRTAVLPLTYVDARRISSVGRDARLELIFERRGSRTVLARAYAEPPLRVGHAFDRDGGVHVILASSAPGIFGGDTFDQHVVVGPGARVRLTSQSSLQIHPSRTEETSRIRATYDVQEDADLTCSWHPAIPFARSRFRQEIDIRLASGARLVWSDALMAGRTARGERWAFSRLAHELAVRRCGALEYLERWRVAVGECRATHPWAAADTTHLGTLLMSGVPVSPDRADALHQCLGGRDHLHSAVERLDDQLLLVRLMSGSAVAFHEARALLEKTLPTFPI